MHVPIVCSIMYMYLMSKVLMEREYSLCGGETHVHVLIVCSIMYMCLMSKVLMEREYSLCGGGKTHFCDESDQDQEMDQLCVGGRLVSFDM